MVTWVLTFLYVHFGIAGTGPWYGFWSGIAGSFLVNVVTFLLVFYVHHTCHDHAWCLRWGKYPAAGGTFRLCRKHHPDMRGHQGTRRELIHMLHGEWKQPGQTPEGTTDDA